MTYHFLRLASRAGFAAGCCGVSLAASGVSCSAARSTTSCSIPLPDQTEESGENFVDDPGEDADPDDERDRRRGPLLLRRPRHPTHLRDEATEKLLRVRRPRRTGRGGRSARGFVHVSHSLYLNSWQGRQDSNLQPTVLETATLPIELLPFALFRFAMRPMTPAPAAVLPQLQALARLDPVFERIVVAPLALGACKHHHHAVFFFRHLT